MSSPMVPRIEVMATNFGPVGLLLFFINGSTAWKSMSGPRVLTCMCERTWWSGVSLAGPMCSAIPINSTGRVIRETWGSRRARRTSVGNDYVELTDLVCDPLGNESAVFLGCRVQFDDANYFEASRSENVELVNLGRVADARVDDDVRSL
jgi:hypothetical protein